MKRRIPWFCPALFLWLVISCSTPGELQITSLTTCYREEATGVHPSRFFFSWKIRSGRRNVEQRAYHIRVAAGKDFSEKRVIWDSGVVDSGESILVPYGGIPLDPGTIYSWKVKIKDNDGRESPWSRPAIFITRLNREEEWSGAAWIALDRIDTAERLVPGIHLPGKEYRGLDLGFHALPIMRKEFSVRKGLKQAIVFVSGLGHYEFFLNGEKVGPGFLSPGWTHYDKTVLYNTFDVTALLSPGRNAAGMMLGNGFFIVPNNRYRKVMTAYGHPMMIIKLQLAYEDGTSETIVSDASWKVAAGPITYSSIFGGETYDATLEREGWEHPGFDDSGWGNAVVVDSPCKLLLPEESYPVVLTDTLAVKRATRTGDAGEHWLFDFGQNASGIFEIRVTGKRGDSIRLVPAELLGPEGEANQEATGQPHYYTYVCRGGGEETWHPRFSYYGMRYLQVEGAVPDSVFVAASKPRILDLKMLHNRHAAPETGSFYTSYPLFNRIDTLIRWAIRSNLQSVVTDCPHREKLGWLEQTWLMGEGIHFNYDVYGLYDKLVSDMADAQTPEGLVPSIAPEFVRFIGGFRDSPEWGSAAVVVPWLLWKWYGDPGPMERAWPMMTRYAEYLRGMSVNHVVSHGLGDWFDLGPERPGYAQLTPVPLTATAVYYYDLVLLSRMAWILGKNEEEISYAMWADSVKQAFNNAFFDSVTKVYATGSQTAISMPLVLGLAEEENKADVIRTLAHSIQESENALTAGDVGFHFLVRALSENGLGELLFRMNARDDVPGYGYQLKKGATALTESWQALEVVSNNHLMLGHLMEWLYGGLAGIGQTEESTAYRNIRIEPQVVGEIKSAGASFESPYGPVVSKWKNDGKRFTLNVEIPANTKAVIVIPAADPAMVTVNGRRLITAKIGWGREGQDKLMITTGSGKYHIEVKR